MTSSTKLAECNQRISTQIHTKVVHSVHGAGRISNICQRRVAPQCVRTLFFKPSLSKIPKGLMIFALSITYSTCMWPLQACGHPTKPPTPNIANYSTTNSCIWCSYLLAGCLPSRARTRCIFCWFTHAALAWCSLRSLCRCCCCPSCCTLLSSLCTRGPFCS